MSCYIETINSQLEIVILSLTRYSERCLFVATSDRFTCQMYLMTRAPASRHIPSDQIHPICLLPTAHHISHHSFSLGFGLGLSELPVLDV
jgi:hypothetical protein